MQPMILANSTEFSRIKLAHANKVLVNWKQLKEKDIVPHGTCFVDATDVRDSRQGSTVFSDNKMFTRRKGRNEGHGKGR
jgi:hypothetical protein